MEMASIGVYPTGLVVDDLVTCYLFTQLVPCGLDLGYNERLPLLWKSPS
jgi:hypothetical protein